MQCTLTRAIVLYMGDNDNNCDKSKAPSIRFFCLRKFCLVIHETGFLLLSSRQSCRFVLSPQSLHVVRVVCHLLFGRFVLCVIPLVCCRLSFHCCVLRPCRRHFICQVEASILIVVVFNPGFVVGRFVTNPRVVRFVAGADCIGVQAVRPLGV